MCVIEVGLALISGDLGEEKLVNVLLKKLI